MDQVWNSLTICFFNFKKICDWSHFMIWQVSVVKGEVWYCSDFRPRIGQKDENKSVYLNLIRAFGSYETSYSCRNWSLGHLEETAPECSIHPPQELVSLKLLLDIVVCFYCVLDIGCLIVREFHKPRSTF